MATSTFDRELEISDLESLKKLIAVIDSDVPAEPFTQHSFTDAERERSEQLLRLCLSRSAL